MQRHLALIFNSESESESAATAAASAGEVTWDPLFLPVSQRDRGVATNPGYRLVDMNHGIGINFIKRRASIHFNII